jgi:type III secretion system YscJ/HrcJ family lipoprotein
MKFAQSLCQIAAPGVLALAVAACTPKVELMAAIPESDANEVLGALQNAGISAQKSPGKEGMVGIQIAADQVGRAVDLLRDQGLPRARFAGMGQVFKKEGLISSPLEERARYLYALSQELGATLNQIDGVILARVHVVLPERSGLDETTSPSSAAVFIKYQEGYDVEAVQPQVRRLVTNSIPGLAAEKLTIVMVPSQPSRTRSEYRHSPPPQADGQPAARDAQAGPAMDNQRPLWAWGVVGFVGLLAALSLAWVTGGPRLRRTLGIARLSAWVRSRRRAQGG